MNDLKTSWFDSLELLPVSVFCCDETARILYRNRFAREQFPGPRRGGKLIRFCKTALPAACGYTEFCGQSCAVFCRTETREQAPVTVYSFVRVAQPVKTLVPALSGGKVSAKGKTASEGALDPAMRRHLLRLIREQDRLTLCGETLFAALSKIRNVRPGGAFAFNAVDFLSNFSENMDRFRGLCGVDLTLCAQAGVTLFANYYDLYASLLCVLTYLTAFLCADTISITLTEKGNTAYIRFFANDPCGASRLYPAPAGFTNLNEQNAFLFPLACAQELCRPYRATLSLTPAPDACKKPVELVTLRVPATLELPHLTVRENVPAESKYFRVLPGKKYRRRKQTIQKAELF